MKTILMLLVILLLSCGTPEPVYQDTDHYRHYYYDPFYQPYYQPYFHHFYQPHIHFKGRRKFN